MDSYLGDAGALITSPLNPDVILSAGYVYLTSAYWSQIALTTDAGLTWHRDTLDSLMRVNTAAFDLNDPNRMYIAGDSYYSYPYFSRSTDAGQTWQKLGTGMAGSVLTICSKAHEPDLLFAGTGSGLYKSTDDGSTWTRKGAMTTVRAIVLDTLNPDNAYCATGAGVYASADGGETWQTFNTGLGVTDVLSLALRSGPVPELFAGTNGGSVYKTDLPTAIGDRLPAHLRTCAPALSIAPNPCSGRALLSARVSSPARVTVSDIAGRRVWTGSLTPAENSLALPGLSAGVYLVRLVTGQSTTTRKLVVQQ
jgi:hypothetical protein